MKNFLNIADHSSSLLRNIIEEAKERKLKREGQNKPSKWWTNDCKYMKII